MPLERVIADIQTLDRGGTLDVFLANHALHRGYGATILTYNLDLFDPTWFSLPNDEIRERLEPKRRSSRGRRLQSATRGYDEFLRTRRQARAARPRSVIAAPLPRIADLVITGLSATYLYRAVRDVPETNADDDIRGEPVGHFVVLTGYRRDAREILIADPLENPLVRSRYYAVQVQRLIGAILLGVMTYDANLLVIEPKRARR